MVPPSSQDEALSRYSAQEISSAGLAVGLDPEGYGNPDFCWISIHDPLIWSFAGPVILVLVVSTLYSVPPCAPLSGMG